MTAQDLAQYRRLLAGQTARTAAQVTAAWDRLGSYTDPADVDRFIAMVAPALAGAKSATVSTASAFYARQLRQHPIAVAAADVASEAKLRDPFLATWHALAEGRPYVEAVQAGRSTAKATADDFITSTARQAGDTFAERSGIDLRWQRVAEPDACDWCQDRDGGIYLSASDGDYGHNRCHCDMVPLAA